MAFQEYPKAMTHQPSAPPPQPPPAIPVTPMVVVHNAEEERLMVAKGYKAAASGPVAPPPITYPFRMGLVTVANAVEELALLRVMTKGHVPTPAQKAEYDEEMMAARHPSPSVTSGATGAIGSAVPLPHGATGTTGTTGATGAAKGA